MDRGGRFGTAKVALRQSLAERDQDEPDAVAKVTEERVPAGRRNPSPVSDDLGTAMARVNLRFQEMVVHGLYLG